MKDLKQFCRELARQSGEVVREYYRTPLQVESKKDDSPVTIADRKAEECLRKLIEREFPEHGILGEEFGAVRPEAEYRWILDPLDGTKSFISGMLTFGTLVALLKNGEPILGMIHQPILNELLIGDNERTELNGQPVSVRECAHVKDALLLTDDHLNVEKHQNGEKFERLIRQVLRYRTWGNCYAYGLLATGYADIVIDPIMEVWDIMGLIPVVRGAGGVITDYQGGDPVKGRSIIAASKTLHPQIVKLLNR